MHLCWRFSNKDLVESGGRLWQGHMHMQAGDYMQPEAENGQTKLRHLQLSLNNYQ